MSSADRREAIEKSAHWLHTKPRQYGFAVLAVLVATALRLGLGALIPFHAPYILFYPAVVLVAMLAGFWPGIVATLLATILGSYFFLEPDKSFQFRGAESIVGPMLFSVIGLFLTFLASSRQRTEQALSESEADLNRAQAVAHIGSWRHDVGKNTLVLSDEACRIMGVPLRASVTPDEMLRKLPPEQRESIRSNWVEVLDRGEYDAEERVLVGGCTRWVRIRASVQRDPHGRPLAAIGTVQDITDRKQAEERLQEYARVVEGLEEMIVVVDRDYRYVIANRAFLNYRGMKREQVIGRRASEILNPGVFETIIKEKLDECFRGKVVEYEMRYKYPVLGERDLLISYFPIEGSEGVERVASVFQDITERKQARTLLERKELLFRTLVESAPIAMVVSVGEGQSAEFYNPKFTELFGYTRDEVPDVDHWWALAYPNGEYRRQISELWNKEVQAAIARKGETAPIAARVRCKDGSERDVEFKLVCAGEKNLVFGTDVTEIKRSERALKLFRTLIDHSNDAVEVVDPETLRFLDINEKACKDLGYTREELLGMTVFDIDLDADKACHAATLEELRHSGCFVKEAVHRRKDGSTFPVETSMNYVELDHSYIVVVARDISDRKRAEAALRSSEQRYRTLFEKTVAGVGILSMEGQLIDCNDAWARMFGYSDARECRGRQITESYPDPAEREVLLGELKRAGAFFNRELQLQRRDGMRFWISLNSVLLTEGGNPPQIQSTIVDITARKQAEEKLLRREEDYRAFVAQSSEGIFRQDLDAPVAIDLPEDELIHHILHDSYLAECNEAIARMYGVTVEDFLGKRMTETLDPNDPRNIELAREYVRSGFRVLERESHEVDMQGNPKVFRNSLIGIVENGKLTRTWGIQRDVTEQVKLEESRVEAEKALRKSEEHFRILVEQASDGIFISDSQGRYTDVNSAGAEMLGHARDEILQLSIPDIVIAADAERVGPEVARFEGGAVIRSEWTFRRKDGSVFPGEVSGKQLPDGRLQAILRDLTERKRAEEVLRQSEERFRVALKDSPIAVFSQDRDLRYTWIYNFSHLSLNDVIGKTDDEIVGPDKARRLKELKQQVLKTGVGAREEIVIPYKGAVQAYDITLEPLFDSERNIVGVTGAAMDIARLRELADGLREAKDKLVQEKLYLEGEIAAHLGFEEIVGQSAALAEVLKKARIVAPTDSTVLLLGETGTGKELVARAVHRLSGRREKNFIKLNCAAVPSGLLESELFGHEKGAFTGAVSQKVGRIELADKGTLFLDEIGELPPELQPKLLRVLQDREFERLGGVHTLRVDVRIISATNRDLQKDVANKRFREDLFYRLNVFPILLPALRERRSDIPVLVRHFVRKHAGRMGKSIENIPSETMAVLQNWNWPGNIRELENMIERMVILTKGQVLAAPPVELDVPQELADDNLTEMEREHIIRVLRETNGVFSGVDGAASRLGIKRTTLQSMIKRLGIEAQDYRRRTGTLGRE